MSKLIAVAQKYLGLKEDGGGNNTFAETNPLKALLKAAGHKNGEAWCSYLMEGLTAEGYPDQEEEIAAVYSANCVQCMRNFIGRGAQWSAYPVVGWVAFFQVIDENGNPSPKGHTALIELVAPDASFATIDGNTGGHGERESSTGKVGRNNWRVGYKTGGLNFLGCVDVEGWLAKLPKKV